ncbi:MAG: DUF4065 domain-containing protein, partial [Brevundimonas sp.]|nr:DUF4065 domain-containing protein [Brevundimonas sp.]
MNSGPYDSRAIANEIVAIARGSGYSVTPLSLQKILYFCHGSFLLSRKRPLVSGYFEAWKNGPVHPVVYNAFNKFGSQPNEAAATALDFTSGEQRALPRVEDGEVCNHLASLVGFYATLPAGTLVEISHVRNGPWWQALNKTGKSAKFGVRITDDLIRE